ncbi:Prephenate dehydratase [Candidatus Magnetaquicoccaceae bacterium FCR-1]|uniref:Prephenate dehydratase n=1 Tax=Candidatus Magnetaquiglobus chichijimensis TaxID=3141448 RepID=A0ABQ0C7G7_9PROT
MSNTSHLPEEDTSPSRETPAREPLEKTVAFQGERGAYSEQACRESLPGYRTIPCRTFEEVFQAVDEREASIGMIPVENSIAGVVSDSYDLLAVFQLHILGEYYLRVRHALLGLPGTRIDDVRAVYSHPQALAQCRTFIRKHGWACNAVYDTAGAAADLAERGGTLEAAIAAELCAELYGLDVLARDIQDSRLNTTRFLQIVKERHVPPKEVPCKTSLIFEVRNIPAALYKCLGGFATNGVNLTRLESRPVPGTPWSYHFYLDFQGRPEERPCKLALEELDFFTSSLKILGSYPESPTWHPQP